MPLTFNFFIFYPLGQYRFYESYFDSQRDTIFRNVEVLIYVFDIDSGDLDNDLTLFDGNILSQSILFEQFISMYILFYVFFFY